MSERERRGVGGHVVLSFAKEHVDDVARLANLVVLHEGQSVTHREQIRKRDEATRVVGFRPFRDRGRFVHAEHPLIDQRANDHVQH